MIHSMTAFARTQNQGDWGSMTCEIRSINHRFLEMSVYLPEALRALEMPIRDCIKQFVKRGKIECGIRCQWNAGSDALSVNATLVSELCKASEKIVDVLQKPAAISVTEILRFPGVLETREVNVEHLQADVINLVKKSMQELVAARLREGEELKQLFLQRLSAISSELETVRKCLPRANMEQRERLLKRFTDAKIELDPLRLEQEMLMYAQKIDINEEIDRTDTHIAEFRRILAEGGSIGRRLDFLLQELNREANTLGSKSVDSVITHAAVEMKVLIEQIREQVQNIE